jgi:hypothetical protein
MSNAAAPAENSAQTSFPEGGVATRRKDYGTAVYVRRSRKKSPLRAAMRIVTPMPYSLSPLQEQLYTPRGYSLSPLQEQLYTPSGYSLSPLQEQLYTPKGFSLSPLRVAPRRRRTMKRKTSRKTSRKPCSASKTRSRTGRCVKKTSRALSVASRACKSGKVKRVVRGKPRCTKPTRHMMFAGGETPAVASNTTTA